MHMETVGQRIKARRRQLGISQSQLAAAAGISRRCLIYAEHNPDRDPSLRLGTLRRIARELDVTVGYLADDPRDPRMAA